MTLADEQALALVEELHSATKLMDLGVAELHKLTMANDFCHLPMQLLSQGIERFLKVTYAMACLGSTGTLPEIETMRRDYGHRLLRLTDDLARLAGG